MDEMGFSLLVYIYKEIQEMDAMQQVSTIELITKLEENHLVALNFINLNYQTTLTHIQMHHCLRAFGLTYDSKPITAKISSKILNDLQTMKLIEDETRLCKKSLQNELIMILAKNSKYQEYKEILENIVTTTYANNNYYWNHNVKLDLIYRDLRLEFYDKDFIAFDNILSDIASLNVDILKHLNFLSFFQNESYSENFNSLPDNQQHYYLKEIVKRIILNSYSLTDYDKAIIAKINIEEITSIHILTTLFTLYFFKNDLSLLNKVRVTIDALKSDEPMSLVYVSLMDCVLKFKQGCFEEVLSEFPKTIKKYREVTFNNKAFPPLFLSVVYPLSLLKLGGEKNTKKLKTITKQAMGGRECQSDYGDIYELLHLFSLDQLGGGRLFESKWEEMHWARKYDQKEILKYGMLNLFYPLVRYFLGKENRNKKVLKVYETRCKESGLHWIAGEVGFLNNTISKTTSELYSGPSRVYLASFLNVKNGWERDLEKMLALFPSTQIKNEKQKESRLIWVVTEEGYSNLVTPKEQKMTANGKSWSKGRNVSLKRLVEDNGFEEGFLQAEDKKVFSAIKSARDYYGSTKYSLDTWVALEHLVGHPLIFMEKEKDLYPIEIELGQIELNVEDGKNGVRVNLNRSFHRYQTSLFENIRDNRYRVTPVEDWAHKLHDLIGDDGLLVPKTGIDTLTSVIKNLSSKIKVQTDLQLGLSRESDIELGDADNTIYIHLYPLKDREGLRLEILVRPLGGNTAFMIPGQGHKKPMTTKKDKRFQVVRSFEDELNSVANLFLSSIELQKLKDHHVFDSSFYGEIDDLETCLELVSVLKDLSFSSGIKIEWPKGEKLKLTEEIGIQNLKLGIKGSKNWLSIDGTLTINDQECLELEEILRLSNHSQGRFVELKNGQFLRLENSLKEKITELETLFDHDNYENLRIHNIKSSQLYDVINGLPQVKSDKMWLDFANKNQELKTFIPKLPITLEAELRNYQEEGFNWLSRLNKFGLGACLADDMGLGKTLQIISVMLENASDGPSLVVAPTSVERNWQKEIGRFAPTLKTSVFRENIERTLSEDDLSSFSIVIVSYGLLQNAIVEFSKVNWNIIALDEAQAIKNSSTKRTKSVKKLKADFKIVATGTPVENHLKELWSQFDFILPGLLGKEETFLASYVSRTEEDGPLRQEKRLKRLISPFILRRLKRDVLSELPRKTEVQLDIELSTEERKFYDSLLKIAIKNIEADVDISAGHSDSSTSGKKLFKILAEITRLRQACCHSTLVSKDINIPSSKLQLFTQTVRELKDGGHRALVFSQFVGHLKLIAKQLESMGISFFYLDGQTPVKKREKLIEGFQNGEADIFLISLKAGGTGINLTAADYVIHMDPWWNPAVEDQATDRAHRIGQKRPVVVYKMVTKNTIEDKIIKLHKQKKELAEAVIGGDCSGSNINTKMTGDELYKLITMR